MKGIRVRLFAKDAREAPFAIRGLDDQDWRVLELLDEEARLPDKASDIAMRVVALVSARGIEVTGWYVTHELPKPAMAPTYRPDPILLLRVGAHYLDVYRWSEKGGR